MHFNNPFYEPYNFAPPLPKDQVSTIRKYLIRSLEAQHTKDKYASDIQIQINTPRMYYKPRHIGSMHRSKNSFSSFDFKVHDQYSRSADVSPDMDTRQLVKISISKKKLDNPVNDPDNISPLSRETVNTVADEVTPSRNFCIKNEGKAREKKVRNAAQYLIKQGNFLKSYIGKESKEFHRRLASVSKSFKLTESRSGTAVREKADWVIINNIEESNELVKKTITQNPKSTMRSLMRMTGEDIGLGELQRKSNAGQDLFKNQSPARRKAGQRGKRRFHTSTATSSGLSFAEKMEQLAIARIVS